MRLPRIELIVRVDDDSFEARLEVPIDATAKQRDAIVATWLGAIKTAVDSCVVERPAT